MNKQVCVELPTSADCVTPLAFTAECRAVAAPSGRRYRSISPAHRAHSSKPAAAVCSGRWMGKTDGQTDRRTDTITLDPAAYYTSSVKN